MLQWKILSKSQALSKKFSLVDLSTFNYGKITMALTNREMFAIGRPNKECSVQHETFIM